jgi:hypothetical protein
MSGKQVASRVGLLLWGPLIQRPLSTLDSLVKEYKALLTFIYLDQIAPHSSSAASQLSEQSLLRDIY